MTSLEFIVGRLMCKEVREFLQREQFKGRRIEFMESSGFIERTFVVRGERDDVMHVHDAMKPLFDDLKPRRES